MTGTSMCTHCVLPGHYPGIEFDGAGVCGHCQSHKSWEYLGEERLHRLLDSFRDKGKEYDCVIGLSGGKDSSYLIHYLAKECNMA